MDGGVFGCGSVERNGGARGALIGNELDNVSI